jgi:hypothetical protein
MPFRRKLQSFCRLGVAERRLVLEAALMLALARLVVLTMPFRLIVPWLRRSPAARDCDETLPRAVGQAVTRAARNVPWNAVCLPQALAAKAMLARRGCGSAFHLGAKLDPDGQISAHAWLIAGGRIVVGASGMRGMAPLARFG